MKSKRDDRVWMRKSDGQLGEALLGTIFQTIWIYGEYKKGQPLVPGPVCFIDDPRDDNSPPSRDFVDLGPI